MINCLHRPLGLAATVVLLALASCETPEGAPAGGLGVQAIQFQDMAVPAGMRLRDRFHESHSRELSGWRFGHFVYGGQTRIEEASSYVLDRMPQHRWELVSDDRPTPTSRSIRFRRGSYAVAYSFERQDAITVMTVDYRTDLPEPESSDR